MSVTISTNSLLSNSLGCIRTMFGDSVTWRAIVEEPNTDWDSLATLITAATSSGPNALARVRLGLLEDDTSHGDYVDPPRIGLRLPDSGDIQRGSTSSFSSLLSVVCTIELPVPDTYDDSFQDAYTDATNKIGGILRDLQRMQMVAGYAHIQRVQLGPIGMVDPDQNNGQQWIGCEVLIEVQGALN